MVCFVVTQHSESELSLCLRYSKTSCAHTTPKNNPSKNPMIIQKEEAVFKYNLFSLFIKILIYFTFVVANIRIKPIPSKFFHSFFKWNRNLSPLFLPPANKKELLMEQTR